MCRFLLCVVTCPLVAGARTVSVVGANAVTCSLEVADDGAPRTDDSDCADGAGGAEGDEDVGFPVWMEGIEGRKDPVAVATSSASASRGTDCS